SFHVRCSCLQYIDVEDAEQVLRAIREVGDRPIDLIMHTPGGQMHASIQIARALNNHKKKVRIMIPHYCMSGGTIIALAADEILMDPDAVIGPIDPQVGDLIRGTYPAPSWIHAAKKKGRKADDTTIIMSDISKKAMELTKDVVIELLENKILDEEKRNSVAQKLLSGEMIHVTPISAKEAIELGLPVNTELPPEVHDLMKFFRSAKSSVEYIE
ncbi:MAG: SDH family Clp fold serine proteinase, partial [Halobacteriota archaeon]